MWYCSGDSSSRQSASDFSTLLVISFGLRSRPVDLAGRRLVPLGRWVLVVRIGSGRWIRIADRSVQRRMRIAIGIVDRGHVLRHEWAIHALLRVGLALMRCLWLLRRS